ncbi:hypothetical protein ONE63_000043 [Megalurothrips usitatus]|uniref:Uncharacterized protein n=1 Tax=Megalurothrips usitatus TaxID=439358 RepID=A0AAV7XX85_9NEOP|nr:hypothetical protein ONE63_000043 [Megalurothrips usitatus]
MEARDKCLPENVTVSETLARVPLQSLLDHTVERLLLLQEDVIKSFGSGEKKFTLKCKWGFDGASGQSNYKQKFDGVDADDSSIVITSLVPLQLLENSTEKIAWYNIRSSSSRLCRPLKIEFCKESSEFSKTEKVKTDEEILHLKPTVVNVTPEIIVKVTHDLACTMIDGKVCSALTGKNDFCRYIMAKIRFYIIQHFCVSLFLYAGISCQRCVVCGAYPSELNNLPLILKKVPNASAFEFGLSPLHSYIRYFDTFYML